MKSSTGGDKTYIDVLKRKLPTQAPSDYSAGAFCLKLSPQWAGIIIGLVDHLLIKGVWENKTPEQWQQIRIWTEEVPSLLEVCEDCEEPEPCPECPEPPEPPKPPITGGAVSVVGALGLTLEELEEYIMGWSLRGQLQYVNGVLCYWSDGCCEWVPIPGDSGEVVPPITGIVSQASGTMTLDEWVAAGKPSVNGLKPGNHQNPSYTNTDSVKCAKASALVEVMKDSTGNIFLAMTAAAGGVGAGAAILAGTIATGLSIPAVIALSIAFVILTVAAGLGYGTIIDGLTALHSNTAAWDDMVCNMTPEMDTGTTITGTDIATMFYWLRDSHGITLDDFEYKILHSLPMSYWIEKVQPLVIDQECLCDQYLPYGYEPPLDLGSFRLEFEGFATIPAGSISPVFTNGVPTVDMSSPVGAGSGQEPETKFHETVSGMYYNKFAAVYAPSSGTLTLGNMKATVEWLTAEPSVGLVWRVQAYRTDTNVWFEAATNNAEDTPPIATAINIGLNNPTIPIARFVVYGRTRNSASDGAPRHARFGDLRFDGNWNGQGFIDLKPETTFTP